MTGQRIPESTTSICADVERFIIDKVAHAGAITAALQPHDNLLSNGLVDSYGLVQLLGFLEERYGIAIDDEEVRPENLENLMSIAAFVARKRSAIA